MPGRSSSAAGGMCDRADVMMTIVTGETGATHTATMATVCSPNVNSLWPHLDLRRTTVVVFPS